MVEEKDVESAHHNFFQKGGGKKNTDQFLFFSNP